MRWRRQRDFEDELRSHLELEADHLVAEGHKPHDARLLARRRFGNVGAAQEQFSDTSGFARLFDLGKDLRNAGRMLRASPAFTTVAMITFALGIGANTAVFSVVNGVLLTPLPYRQPERVVQIWESLPGASQIMVAYPDYLDWRTRTRVFEDIAIYTPYGLMSMTGGELPMRVSVGRASGNLFSLLGVGPILGRTFSVDDDKPSAPLAAVITEQAWQQRFASDPAVIGRRIALDGDTYTVIGVIPLTVGLGRLDFWIPIGHVTGTPSYVRANHPGLIGIGRLKPGITISQMNADLERVSSEIRAEHPTESAGISAGGDFLTKQVIGNVQNALRMLAGAVALVLLIACVNVASLLLGRATSRRKEIALRRALGASGFRIARLLLVENVLLSLSGGALGVALAYGGLRALIALQPTGVPRLQQVHIDARVLGFAALISILTGLISGLLPARHAWRVDLTDALKEGLRASTGGGTTRARAVLMTVQIALAMMLLVGAGLLVRSFDRLRHVDPGVDPRGVVTASINLPAKAYAEDDRIRQANFEILRRIQALPGVTSAAITTALPLGGNIQNKITFEGHPRPKGQEPLLNVAFISPDYFKTVRQRVIAGRGIDASDVAGAPMAAVISETIANRYFPDENPIGKRLIHGAIDSKEVPWIVVGVVNDVPVSSLDEQPIGTIYLSFHQTPIDFSTLVVRTSLPPSQLLPAIGRQVASFDPTLPIGRGGTLESWIGGSISQERFTTFMLAVFATVALLLAGVGVYGIIAYVVQQRSHEIGIRMALGAQRRDVVAMVGSRVFIITIIGVTIGILGAVAGRGVMKKLLFDVTALDSTTYALSAATLIIAAALAALAPTLRATRVDPARTIRAQ
jgi:putative ABC transport system permease protein